MTAILGLNAFHGDRLLLSLLTASSSQRWKKSGPTLQVHSSVRTHGSLGVAPRGEGDQRRS